MKSILIAVFMVCMLFAVSFGGLVENKEENGKYETKLICELGAAGQYVCAQYCQSLGARGGYCSGSGVCTCIW